MHISIQHIDAGFAGVPVFKDFSLEIAAGAELNESPVVLLGPSGCGKTTLLRLAAGLLKPQSGSVSAPQASVMFQEARLLPQLTVLENVALPMFKICGRAAAEERAWRFLNIAALAHKTYALPQTLSGGELQRAAMARAFTYDAPLLLLDEPFQSLDIPLRISLMETLAALLKDDRRFSVIVTHDPREALYLGRRIIVLGRKNGRAEIVLDEKNESGAESKRRYVNAAMCVQEQRLIDALTTHKEEYTLE